MTLIALSLLACSFSDSSEPTAEAPEPIEASEPAELEAIEITPSDQMASIDLEVLLDTDAPELEATDAPPAPETFAVQVRSGENLVLIAGWGDVSVEDLVATNDGLDPADPVFPGQEIQLLGGEEESIAYTASRQAFVDAKLERYMNRRGGLVGVDEHRVETGDTAWGLASEVAEVPMWVLAEFNNNGDLDRLRIGDRVMLPVLGDTIELAEAPPEAIGSSEPGALEE
ncbi:MAG: LysM peptidoglycan-binding domain-containing protein [Proteobacteria bacterium]|nr:LysM peptidoglycan-binding domain-containing protein [Pseudomonadota bacterium]MCP4917089.1 LysM peptidoglycan-binding domain-containing protein [Pseudomonadota bacterium]